MEALERLIAAGEAYVAATREREKNFGPKFLAFEKELATAKAELEKLKAAQGTA